jgi:hypothetical protein
MVIARSHRVWFWFTTGAVCSVFFYISWMKLAGFVWDWRIGWSHQSDGREYDLLERAAQHWIDWLLGRP